MFLRASKQKIYRHFWHLLACESKRSLTIIPNGLITIVSLSSSSNKLGNNFNCDTNLLMRMPSLLISNKKVLSCKWLATNNNCWCRKELKMWISVALFEQKRFSFDNLAHVVFWTKDELFYKNPLKRSVLKSQFQNPRNLDEQNWFFHDSRKNNFEFTTE